MLRIASIAVLALSACALDEEVVSETEQEAGGGGCPFLGCNSNSPVMGPYNFHEGNVYGLENEARVRFMNFQIGSQIYQPQIVGGDRLIAVHSSGAIVQGAALAGGVFNVWTPTGPYKIIITQVHSNVTFWVGTTSQTIETYELFYTGPGGTGDRLCKNPPSPRYTGDNGLWKAPLEAMFYSGDRYDSEDKTVSIVPPSSGWFNIACSGSALAKLHLNRHTSAGAEVGFTTGKPERQAMLKMYVSDVCGNGKSWTHAGVPLSWENAQGWTTLTGTTFEAIWGEQGAVCLDTHRLGPLYQNAGGFLGDCAPPPCNGVVANPTFGPGEYFATATP